MPTNLQNFSPTALTDAVELNIQELGTLWGHALGADFHHEPEATWFVSGGPNWTHNWVTKTMFIADTPQERIDTILTRLSAYKLPMFWPVDSSSSSDFTKKIKEYGWRGGGKAIWARDLHSLGERSTLPEGVTVELVKDGESLAEWMRVFVAGYGGLPGDLYKLAAEALAQRGFANPPGVYYYLGRLNGEPVTTTLLFLGGGVAGIYCTATLPHARRHGVASAVVRESLFGARTMGYHIAALQATEMGEPVYRDLGFEVCGNVNFYFLPGASEDDQ
jgi:GNAT superfamily N-acetyltransferase